MRALEVDRHEGLHPQTFGMELAVAPQEGDSQSQYRLMQRLARTAVLSENLPMYVPQGFEDEFNIKQNTNRSRNLASCIEVLGEFSEEKFRDFFASYLDGHSSIWNNPVFQANLASLKRHYKNRLEELSDDGVNTEKAIERVQDHIDGQDDWRICLADSLHFSGVNGMGALAYISRDRRQIVFGAGLTSDDNRQKSRQTTTGVELALKRVTRYAPHEFNHAFLGSFGPTTIDEAFAEHFNQVIQGNRKLTDIWPRKDKIYNPNRKILAHIAIMARSLTGGSFTEIEFLNLYPEFDETQDKEGFCKLTNIFGFDVVDEVCRVSNLNIASAIHAEPKQDTAVQTFPEKKQAVIKATKKLEQQFSILRCAVTNELELPGVFSKRIVTGAKPLDIWNGILSEAQLEPCIE